MKKSPGGFVLWLTGLPCSGKTTLSDIIAAELLRKGLGVRQLDGDALRSTISKDLQYSKRHRGLQVARVSAIADDFSRSGSVAIVSLVSPYRSHRDRARKKINSFVEVHVDCPVGVCERRDVKGMYRLARQGKIREFTGVSSPYEPPEKPEIVVDTARMNSQSCAGKIMEFLASNHYL